MTGSLLGLPCVALLIFRMLALVLGSLHEKGSRSAPEQHSQES